LEATRPKKGEGYFVAFPMAALRVVNPSTIPILILCLVCE
jgi:hypothetical protein